jgi:YVTN family beta-propeller protein
MKTEKFNFGLIKTFCPRPIIALFVLGIVPSTLTTGLAQLPSNTVVATIPVGIDPQWCGVSPDSGTVYVVGGGAVSVINAATNTVTSTITIGGLTYDGILTPDGKTLYVADEADHTVSVIATATNTITDTVKIGRHASRMAVSPDGKTLYVGQSYGGPHNGLGLIKIIDTATNAFTGTINLGRFDLLNLFFTPDGSSAYVSGANEYAKRRFPQKLVQIDTASQTIVDTTAWKPVVDYVGYAYMTISPDGKKLYVERTDAIAVFDTSDKKVRKTIPLPGSATIPAVTPDGEYLYVPIYSTSPGTVVMIGTASGQIVGEPITVGSVPAWVTIAPNANFAYVTNSQDNTVTVINISPQ